MQVVSVESIREIRLECGENLFLTPLRPPGHPIFPSVMAVFLSTIGRWGYLTEIRQAKILRLGGAAGRIERPAVILDPEWFKVVFLRDVPWVIPATEPQ